MAAPRRRGGNLNIPENAQEIPIRYTESTVPWNGPPCVSNVWAPKVNTAFKLILSFRLTSAIWSNISDCDETYNYWEPAHFMLYGQGFQTWEYSPTYAIRSYAYILLHILPIKLLHFFTKPDKLAVFYLMRCMLALLCTASETYFYRGILKQFGASVARLTLALLLTSTGMYISAASFLPSTFSMYMTMVSMSAWYSGHIPIAIFATAVSAFLGWPFAAVLGLPIALDLIWRRQKLRMFMSWSVGSALLILIPIVYYDSSLFGKLVIAPLNIVLYNVLTSHGPDLYGTEPWTFYFVNGFLNFNFTFLLALPVIVLVYLSQKLTGLKFPGIPHFLTLMPMYLWMLIFFTQAHKEERFLFPIYPLICLSAAMSVDHIQRILSHMSRFMRHYTEYLPALPPVLVVVTALVSFSRILALFHGYHAPLEVYSALTNISTVPSIHRLRSHSVVYVCTGKEWYRYPSSFFMPNDKWSLKFLKSEFKGQLPGRYREDLPLYDATSIVRQGYFNDMNLEETSRYAGDMGCHYLIDLDIGRASEREPNYSNNPDRWRVIHTVPFLNHERSNKLLRAFYIPILSDQHCVYGKYTIYQAKRPAPGGADKKKTDNKDTKSAKQRKNE